MTDTDTQFEAIILNVIKRAVELEREACAKICDDEFEQAFKELVKALPETADDPELLAGSPLAARIRARSVQ